MSRKTAPRPDAGEPERGPTALFTPPAVGHRQALETPAHGLPCGPVRHFSRTAAPSHWHLCLQCNLTSGRYLSTRPSRDRHPPCPRVLPCHQPSRPRPAAGGTQAAFPDASSRIEDTAGVCAGLARECRRTGPPGLWRRGDRSHPQEAAPGRGRTGGSAVPRPPSRLSQRHRGVRRGHLSLSRPSCVPPPCPEAIAPPCWPRSS
jgi:hypothetical protein